MKLQNISHVFAICDKDKESNRYNDLNGWMIRDFEDKNYFTIDAYCYGDNLKENDLIEYNIDKNLNKGNKSLYLNHIKIFENILKNYSENDNFLILESDAVPVDNYVEILNDQLSILKNKDFDYLDVGNGCKWTPEKFGHVLNEKNDVYPCKSSRCAHSIVWSHKGIKNFYENLKNENINFAFDHMIYKIILKTNANIYWGHPFSFKQGSQCRIYHSLNN